MNTTATTHVNYPHEPGRLFECPACEARCYCTPGTEECIYSGEHDDSPARIAALAEHTEYDADTYEPVGDYAPHMFTDGGAEWLVLTDEEADAAAAEYIAESLWAFRSEYLADFTGLPVLVFQPMQEAAFESCNDAIRAIIGDRFDEFVDDAISADGRGHFLAQYDHEEVELDGGLYAYRTN